MHILNSRQQMQKNKDTIWGNIRWNKYRWSSLYINGFTGARNGQIIPEWSLSGEYVKPKKGAELHKVVNGKDTVVAIFDGKHFVEVKGK